ncbi:hypothetical protein KM043_011133 [Ampulex compressa]|nr:hypothetical protein KM043_011133 [Ampulex compressa]
MAALVRAHAQLEAFGTGSGNRAKSIGWPARDINPLLLPAAYLHSRNAHGSRAYAASRTPCKLRSIPRIAPSAATNCRDTERGSAGRGEREPRSNENRCGGLLHRFCIEEVRRSRSCRIKARTCLVRGAACPKPKLHRGKGPDIVHCTLNGTETQESPGESKGPLRVDSTKLNRYQSQSAIKSSPCTQGRDFPYALVFLRKRHYRGVVMKNRRAQRAESWPALGIVFPASQGTRRVSKINRNTCSRHDPGAQRMQVNAARQDAERLQSATCRKRPGEAPAGPTIYQDCQRNKSTQTEKLNPTILRGTSNS